MKKLGNQIRNQKGMTELLIVLGIAVVGGIMLTTSATMVNRATQDNRGAIQKAGSQDLKREMEMFLQINANCMANFAGAIPAAENAGTPVTDVFTNSDSTEIFKLGDAQLYSNNMLRLQNWSLEESGRILEAGTPEVSVVNLNLNLQRIGGNGPQNIRRQVKLVATKAGGPGTPITDCYGLVGEDSDLWVRASGAGDRIYTTVTGNVGIGTRTPGQKLDVVGDSLVIGNHLADLFTSMSTTVADDQLQLTGNLGVNKTAVAGRRLDVLGDSHVAGNESVTGLKTVQTMNQNGNLDVQNDLTVTGNASFGRLRNTGFADARGTARFDDATAFGNTAMMQSLSVGNASFAPSGTLNVTGDIDVSATANIVQNVTANQICIGGNCRTTFATQSCPAGMVRQIASTGVVACETPSCGPGSYLQALNGTPTPTCGLIPNQACTSTDQYIEAANPYTGAVTCRSVPATAGSSACPAGQLMVEVSAGVAQCLAPSLTAGSCGGGQSVIGENANGGVICGFPGTGAFCGPGQVAIGMGTNGSVTCRALNIGITCPGTNVVGGINADGTPICVAKPSFVTGNCPAGQVLTGITPTGGMTCGAIAAVDSCPVFDTSYSGRGPAATPLGCSCNNPRSDWVAGTCQAWVDCQGSWGGCSATCGGGTRSYTWTTLPVGTGAAACPFANGAVQACNTNPCPVNCVGSWGACSAACGGGTQTFTVTTPAANGGVACSYANGATQACNTAACPALGNTCNPAGLGVGQACSTPGQLDACCPGNNLQYEYNCNGTTVQEFITAGPPGTPCTI